MPEVLAGLSAVVVEDDPDTLDLFSALLALGGATVRAFARAREALAALQTGPRPDVILTDLRMPGEDGFWLLDRLAESPALRQVPVIVMSAHASGEYQARARLVGARFVLAKPVEFDELWRALAAVVGGPAPHAAVARPLSGQPA